MPTLYPEAARERDLHRSVHVTFWWEGASTDHMTYQILPPLAGRAEPR